MRRAEISISDADEAVAVAELLASDGWDVLGGGSGDDASGGGGELAGAGPDVVAHVCDASSALIKAGLARRMVVIGPTAEEALRVALRIGASEAVAWPGEQKLLLNAVRSASRPNRERRGAKRRIGFVSVRSGGATALVANVADALGRHGVECTAIDCDPAHGDLTGLLLEGEPVTSLEDAIARSLDPQEVAVDAKKVALVPARGGGRADADCLRAIGAWADSHANRDQHVFLYDLPSAFLASCGNGAGEALTWLDLCILLVPLDFAGVRRARMVIDNWPERLRASIRMLVVERRRHGLDAADAIEVLGLDHLGSLPPGGESLDESLDEGRLLGARPATPYGRAVDQLAGKLKELTGLVAPAKRARAMPQRSGSLLGLVSTRFARVGSI